MVNIPQKNTSVKLRSKSVKHRNMLDSKFYDKKHGAVNSFCTADTIKISNNIKSFTSFLTDETQAKFCSKKLNIYDYKNEQNKVDLSRPELIFRNLTTFEPILLDGSTIDQLSFKEIRNAGKAIWWRWKLSYIENKYIDLCQTCLRGRTFRKQEHLIKYFFLSLSNGGISPASDDELYISRSVLNRIRKQSENVVSVKIIRKIALKLLTEKQFVSQQHFENYLRRVFVNSSYVKRSHSCTL